MVLRWLTRLIAISQRISLTQTMKDIKMYWRNTAVPILKSGLHPRVSFLPFDHASGKTKHVNISFQPKSSFLLILFWMRADSSFINNNFFAQLVYAHRIGGGVRFCHAIRASQIKRQSRHGEYCLVIISDCGVAQQTINNPGFRFQ